MCNIILVLQAVGISLGDHLDPGFACVREREKERERERQKETEGGRICVRERDRESE